MVVMLLVVLPVAAIAVAGIVVIWIAASGVYRYPTCRCGYDLRGTLERTDRCPECGAPNVSRGREQTIRHPRLLLVGLILLVSPMFIVLLVSLFAFLYH